MNIYLREIKRNYVNFIIWFSISALMIIYVIFMFPSFKSDITELLKLKFPVQLQQAFGMDKLDFSNIIGFLGLMIPYIIMLGGIFSGMLFGTVVSKEENDGTIEFLFSKPITRFKIAFSKLMAAITYIAVYTVLVFFAALMSLKAINVTYSMKTFWLLALSVFLALLLFGFLCFFVSMLVYRTKTIVPISVGIVAGTYILKAVSGISTKSAFLKYLSPYEYFDSSQIIQNNSLRIPYLIISVAIMFICIILGLTIYNTKDFKA